MFHPLVWLSAAALCAIVALLNAITAERPLPRVVTGFQSGEIVGGRVNTGDAEAAERLVLQFAHAAHTGIVDPGSGRSWWALVTIEGSRSEMALLCAVSKLDREAGTLRFEGTAVRGPVAGATVGGEVYPAADGSLFVRMQVQRGAVAVTFVQRLEEGFPPAPAGSWAFA